jgi:SP family general alpha glucoside:H+ symporter-like MFS transporter
MWPAPLFIVAFFAPESPWWLVRKGRFDDAKRSLTRLTSAKGKEDFDADQTIAMMRHTIASEKEVSHPFNDSRVRILMEGYCGCDVPRLF